MSGPRVPKVENDNFDPTARTVMHDYQQTTCGWYSEVLRDGVGIADEVGKMLYLPGYCTCP